MKLTLNHQFYRKPTPGSRYESRFTLATDDGTIGQMMTEKQARSAFKALGFKFPNKSRLQQWVIEIN